MECRNRECAAPTEATGWLVRLAALLWAAVMLAAPAAAQDATSLRGVALVIGNGDYEHLAPLANPVDDARAVEELLDRLGFETDLSSDRDARRLARDLEDFVEDAKGADVAIVYYAGHGIEAGGENFLVPVDADLSALEAAGEKLVPLSRFIADLQATVPIAIMLLDACRDNPFPPGAMVRTGSGATAEVVAASGLGETRGATRLAASSAENHGTVLGFAAEPGRAALDGEPGQNSPYAAAVLRHLETMPGEEFGLVMRMVAEEVYLKTGGRQRPWVNESLRRLLYFGQAPEPVEGETGEILSERRRLLLTIASLPDPDRRRVEAVARDGGVPMDAVYAMLNALGAEAPSDPAQLDAMLRGQADQLKQMMAERTTLTSSDPEILRLAALADTAIGEGAIEAAISILDRAKSRVGELEKTIEEVEADIRERRIEFAAIHARSAEAHLLAFDHEAAAAGFAEALAQVERWDGPLAWRYRDKRAEALSAHGNFTGDNDALAQAVEVAREAVRLGEGVVTPLDLASTQMVMGNALQYLGERSESGALLEVSAQAYREALARFVRDDSVILWAKLHNNLANTLTMIGERGSDPARLSEAIAAYEIAVPAFQDLWMRGEWATAQLNLGRALLAVAATETGTDSLMRAGQALEKGLYETDRAAAPLLWGALQNNLGNAFQLLGLRTPDHNIAGARHLQAVVAFRNALGELTRERVPLQWAIVQTNLANALQALGRRELGQQAALRHFADAAAAQRAATEEITRERSAFQWGIITLNLALTYEAMAGRETDAPAARAHRLEAVAALRLAAEEVTATNGPVQHAQIMSGLGRNLHLAALAEPDAATAIARLEEAAAAHQAAVAAIGQATAPLQWASSQHERAETLLELGVRMAEPRRVDEAEAAFAAALTIRTRQAQPLDWASSSAGVANARFERARLARDAAGAEAAMALMSEVRAFLAEGGATGDDYFEARIAAMETALATFR